MDLVRCGRVWYHLSAVYGSKEPCRYRELEKIETHNYSFSLCVLFLSFVTMLNFHTTAMHLLISGNTFPIKHILYAVGGFWDAPSSSWRVPLAVDGAIFRCSLQNCELLQGGGMAGGHDLPFWTDRAKSFAKLGVLAKKQQGILDTDFWWICCERCTVKNWHRQMVTCPCHGR